MMKQALTCTDIYATVAYMAVLFVGAIKFLHTLSKITGAMNQFVYRSQRLDLVPMEEKSEIAWAALKRLLIMWTSLMVASGMMASNVFAASSHPEGGAISLGHR